MEQLNNLDVFFLIIVGISSLVGIARGFTKESLSLLGWIIAGASVYFLTPIVNPIMQNYIASEMLSKFVSGLLVLLVVCIFWVLAVDKISSSIRQSKLSPLDRIFGLGFGVLRGGIVVVLLVMMISALIPEDAKKGVFAASKIFVASESYIEPIKSLIPEETLNDMQAQMEKFGFGAKKAETEDEKNVTDKEEKADKKADKKVDEKTEKTEKAEEKEAVKAEKTDSQEQAYDKKEPTEDQKEEPAEKQNKTLSDNAKEAFMELVQPKVEGEGDAEKQKPGVSFDDMAGELQKLVDALEDQTITTDEDDFGL